MLTADTTANAEVKRGPQISPTLQRVLALAPGTAVGVWMIIAKSANPFGARRFTLADDAMISMTYARTLARGGGLAWFEGAPRVEGITNPLWTFYMALLHAVGLEGSAAAAVVAFTGLATVLATAWVAGRLSTKVVAGARWSPLFVTATVALSFPLLYWSTQGMEVGLFTLLTVLAVDLAARHAGESDRSDRSNRDLLVLAVVLATGCLVRMDFVVVSAVVIAWAIWNAATPRRRRSVAAYLVGATAFAVGAVSVARFVYFGELVPNTYVLKMDGVSSLERVARGLSVSLPYVPILVLGLCGAVVLLRRTTGRQRRVVVLVTAIWATQFAYGTWVGGDAWEFITSRFVATVAVCTAILALAAAESPANTDGRSSEIGKLVTALGGLLFALWILPATNEALASAVPGFGYVVAVPLMAVGLALWASSHRSSTGGTTDVAGAAVVPVFLVSIAVLFTTCGGGVDAYQTGWIRFHDRYDQSKSEYGLRIAELLRPGGTMAVVWAGAQVYYSDRPAIDLLGKSDPVIARSDPKGPFYPGHNKWDYRHSVAGLKPDVIADPEVIPMLYPGDTDYRQISTDEAYERRCIRIGDTGSLESVWIRKGSPNVDSTAPQLVRCP